MGWFFSWSPVIGLRTLKANIGLDEQASYDLDPASSGPHAGASAPAMTDLAREIVLEHEGLPAAFQSPRAGKERV